MMTIMFWFAVAWAVFWGFLGLSDLFSGDIAIGMRFKFVIFMLIIMSIPWWFILAMHAGG